MENHYLTDMPPEMQGHGIPKVLVVRKEVIHLKHIMTEVFVRRTLDIDRVLDKVGMDLMSYMQYMTNRMRKVHHFSRKYNVAVNTVVKEDRDRFFPALELYKGLNVTIVLDFDGVITSKRFTDLYRLCCERGKVQICSANPSVSEEWFDKRGLPRPFKIHAMKGKLKKCKRLLELQKKYDICLYVDNETEYLNYAWLFGIHTYHYRNGKIMYHSLKTK